MAGALRKSMEWLGLTEMRDDRYEEYDEYEDYDVVEEDAIPDPAPAPALRAAPAPVERVERTADVHRLPQRTPVARVVREPEPAPMSRITTIHPRTYNEAKDIGEAFREGVPVIMNLSDMDDNDAKRLVDFAAGLVFGLHGAIERVTSKVFLLSPEGIEVESGLQEAARAGSTRGLFNQS